MEPDFYSIELQSCPQDWFSCHHKSCSVSQPDLDFDMANLSLCAVVKALALGLGKVGEMYVYGLAI